MMTQQLLVLILLYILTLIIMATWKKVTSIRELVIYILLSNAGLLTVEVIYKSEWFIQITTGM